MPEKESKKHKGEGHRKRLRDKFLKAGIEALHDYEIIELLLSLGTPRKDCKEQAKAAMRKFKGLQDVLEASLDELQQIKGIGPVNAFGIKLFQAVSERYLKDKIVRKKRTLKSTKEIFDYLYQTLQKEKEEVFKVLYLNNANRILGVEEISRGATDQAVVYPRKVIKSALDRNAAKLIFAHNHPSGNLNPSDQDIQITRKLKKACNSVEVKLVDHIIVGRKDYYSFRENDRLF